MRSLIAFPFGAALVLWTQSSLGVLVTISPTAPSSNLLVSHSAAIPNFTESWQWIDNTGNDHRDIGQSFLLPGSDMVSLDAVTVRVGNPGASVASAPFSLEIWTVSDATDDSGNLLLDSQSGTLPSTGIASNTFWTFDLDNLVLDEGAYYAFMLAFDSGPAAGRTISLVEDFTSGYANGRWLARNGTPTDWSSITNDAEFYIQGAALIIPEPSSFLLLGLGVLGLVRHARRRRKAQPTGKYVISS